MYADKCREVVGELRELRVIATLTLGFAIVDSFWDWTETRMTSILSQTWEVLTHMKLTVSPSRMLAAAVAVHALELYVSTFG